MTRTRLLILVIMLASVMAACTPYPRYRKDPPVTPEVQGPITGRVTTKQFMRLGQILQDHLGKPYAGTSKHEPGLDCSGFTQDVFRKFNRTLLPRTAQDQYNTGKKIPVQRLRFGDLVFYRTERSNKITHVGVYIDQKEFIHATNSRGIIISGMGEKYWAERYAGARRVLK